MDVVRRPDLERISAALDERTRNIVEALNAELERDLSALVDEPMPPPFLGLVVGPIEARTDGYRTTYSRQTTPVRATSRADFETWCGLYTRRIVANALPGHERINPMGLLGTVFVLREDHRWATPDGQHPRGPRLDPLRFA